MLFASLLTKTGHQNEKQNRLENKNAAIQMNHGALTECLSLVGGDSRIRTGDILLAKQTLYQLSYIPTRDCDWWE